MQCSGPSAWSGGSYTGTSPCLVTEALGGVPAWEVSCAPVLCVCSELLLPQPPEPCCVADVSYRCSSTAGFRGRLCLGCWPGPSGVDPLGSPDFPHLRALPGVSRQMQPLSECFFGSFHDLPSASGSQCSPFSRFHFVQEHVEVTLFRCQLGWAAGSGGGEQIISLSQADQTSPGLSLRKVRSKFVSISES